MTTYLIRRILLMIPTFFAITLLVFSLCRLVPGGPIEKQRDAIMMAAIQEGGNGGGYSDEMEKMIKGEMSPEDKAELMKHYGISDSVIKDYLRWVGGIFSGDFGKSDAYNEPVLKLIWNRMPISIFYGLTTMFFIYGVCIPLGVVKALKNKSIIDNVTSVIVFVGYAIPGYALGAILVVFCAAKWGWFPIGGFVSDNFQELNFGGKVVDLLHHAIMPLMCYLIGGFAFMTMLVKNTLLENLSFDYIRTALAKGVPYKRAVFKHALDNSLIPLATHFGNNISLIIGGSFLIEKIFDIEGMGLLGFNALEGRDFPVVMGILAISCVLQMTGNLLSDICVAYVDPRVKYE